MSDDDEVIKRIRANSARVLSMAKDLGASVGFDQGGVEWLDGFIQRQHEQGNAEIRDNLTQVLGSFLGECIVRSFGGAWAKVNGSWAVRFDDRNWAYPFTKVSKHLNNGAEAGDSVLGFYASIRTLFKQSVGAAPPDPPPPPPKKHWWKL